MKLTIEPSLGEGIHAVVLCDTLYRVDQNCYAICKKGNCAFTWGALPCLNVVVHNQTQEQGCLAHVSFGALEHNWKPKDNVYHNLEAVNGIKYDNPLAKDFSSDHLSHKLAHTLQQMIIDATDGKQNCVYDIWFGAGVPMDLKRDIGFTGNVRLNAMVETNKFVSSLGGSIFWQQYEKITHNCELDIGNSVNVLYVPHPAGVYLLSTNEELKRLQKEKFKEGQRNLAA